MAIDVLIPPKAVWSRASQWLAALAHNEAFMTRQLSRKAQGALSLAAPHPRFSVPLEGVKTDGDFENAYMLSWRYVVCHDGNAVAFLDLSASGRAQLGKELRISEAPMVAAAAGVLAKLAGGEDSGRRTHALGFLSMPALRIEALWLRHRRLEPSRDRFVPVLLPGGLAAQAPLRPKRFMALLVQAKQDAARDR